MYLSPPVLGISATLKATIGYIMVTNIKLSDYEANTELSMFAVIGDVNSTYILATLYM